MVKRALPTVSAAKTCSHLTVLLFLTGTGLPESSCDTKYPRATPVPSLKLFDCIIS